jgi:serine/threonine protein kinase
VASGGLAVENLLLMGDHLVKITDFGVCSHPRHNIEPYGRGTFDCGAPEFHLDLPMGQPADLWSFG